MPEWAEGEKRVADLTSVEGSLDALGPLPIRKEHIQPKIPQVSFAKPIKLTLAVTKRQRHPGPVSPSASQALDPIFLASVLAAGEDVVPLGTGSKTVSLTPASEQVPTSFEPLQPGPAFRSNIEVSGSAWILYRPNSTVAPLAGAGQLGGSQAGLQVSLPVAKIPKFGTIALQAQLTRALQTPGQEEAGIGVRLTLRPKIPIKLVVERRIRIGDGGRNAFAFGLISGVDNKMLPKGVLVSAYGQAGIVGLRTHDLYVDGAIRAEHRAFTSGTTAVRVGVAAWGAAQPGVSRIDIGPRISGSFRIGGTRLQASVEWRERLTGNALPNSGPVLTIGTDF